MLASKKQLRANRRHGLNAWLEQNNMRMDEAAFWTTGQKMAEQQKFAELDAVYEAAKAQLSTSLKALTEAEWLAWCEEIG